MADIVKNPKDYEKYEMDKVFTIKRNLDAHKLRDLDDEVRALTLKFNNDDEIKLISLNETNVKKLRKQLYEDFYKLDKLSKENDKLRSEYVNVLDKLIDKIFDYEC